MVDCADHFDPVDKAVCCALEGIVDCGTSTRGMGTGTVTMVDKAFGACVIAA